MRMPSRMPTTTAIRIPGRGEEKKRGSIDKTSKGAFHALTVGESGVVPQVLPLLPQGASCAKNQHN
jgi:hypothetical protein